MWSVLRRLECRDKVETIVRRKVEVIPTPPPPALASAVELIWNAGALKVAVIS